VEATQVAVAVGTVRDGVEAVFYIVVGVLTVLTFLAAKKTFLQPKHAEVFRLVAEQCIEIMREFAGKGEMVLRQDLHLDKMAHANVMLLVDAYAQGHLGLTLPDEAERLAKMGDFPVWTCNVESLVSADHPYVPLSPESSSVAEPGAWDDFKVDRIVWPRETSEYLDRLTAMQKSPMTPASVAKLLGDYVALAHEAGSCLMGSLQEAAPELVLKYPSEALLRRADLSWLSNLVNHDRPDFEPLSLELCKVIRDYLGVDETFE
jgi:hypothetical protein